MKQNIFFLIELKKQQQKQKKKYIKQAEANKEMHSVWNSTTF